MLGLDKSFVTGGDLGMAPFPSVAGGTGNPADLAGNTASYVSIASKASPAQKSAAEAFMQTCWPRPPTPRPPSARARSRSSRAPPTCSPASSSSSYDQTIYSSVQQAPSFQYSWDQAVPPQEATPMLADLAQVFELIDDPAEVRGHDGQPAFRCLAGPRPR